MLLRQSMLFYQYLFIAALGMSIGMGGGSIISRALGSNEKARANKVFGNQLTLTFLFTLTFMAFGLVFLESIIPLFGGKGNSILWLKLLYHCGDWGAHLGFLHDGNNTIRAEGKPKNAMYSMVLPSISNLILDYVFIYQMGWVWKVHMGNHFILCHLWELHSVLLFI